jgi:Zn-dependent M28 family amino/carboxypeptidase
MSMRRVVPGILAGGAAVLLLAAAGPMPGEGFSGALAAVSGPRIGARIRFLADDLLEGRATGARGSEIAARYIAAELAGDGVRPAGDDGTFLQHFEMVGVSVAPSTRLALTTPKGALDLVNGENAVISTRQQIDHVKIDAPLYFVGYGISAPERNWDDYAGFDASGKVLVCLVNDPGSQDPGIFGGKALSYYGRWTYKYEEAARHHAAGILLVHTNESAGYGWQVVRNSWSGEQEQLPLEAGREDLPLDGWMTKDAAERLFDSSGHGLEAAIAEAGRRGFRPYALDGSRAEGDLAFRIRRYRTENVVGILEGSDPARKNTYVAITAHFDHLGIGRPDATGDRIYNGAQDNASGVATLLEIARAAADGGWRPARSILFVSVTAEEQGLLGSAYFARHLPVPADRVAADFNMDGTSVYGETLDYTLLGADRTTLGPLDEKVAGQMRVRLDPDAHPEQGSYFRSDHFNFAKVGIPAVSVKHGWLFRGHDAAYGERVFNDYNDHHYHQPSDEYDPGWDLSGTVQECRFVMRLIEAVSEAPEMPKFRKGALSRAERESR